MKRIDLAEQGVRPGEDVSARINELLAQNPRDTEFVLAPGTYLLNAFAAAGFSVSLSNSDQRPVLRAGLLLQNMRNVRLSGGGATLLCRGQLSALAVLACENVTVENLTVDYAPSHNGEGVVLAASSTQADVAIDRARYPYEVRKGRLYFDNGEEYTPYFGAIEFDALTRRTAYRTGDRFRSARQEELSPGVVRFHGRFDPVPTVGNLLTLRYSPRIHPGVLVHDCKDVTLDGITLHNTCGLGVLSQFSRDLRYRRVVMRPNEAVGRRVVSCHDDGLHFSNDAGSILVDECYFHGLMDDPVNVHGTALRIRSIDDGRGVTAEFAHEQSSAFPLWARAGHTVSFIERNSMASLGTAAVESFSLLAGNGCAVRFRDDLPAALRPGDALENLSNTPQVTVQNSFFGACRARGVLVSTPRPVVIRHNVFESAGSAVLIPGDANNWYESGACTDVRIEENHFTDGCLTSMYQFCEGVVSICPEVPRPDPARPFHRNIRITGNTFHVFDAPVLYALCTKSLRFTDNTVVRSRAYAPWHPRRAMATLAACTDVTVADNRFVGDVLSTEVVTEA